MYLHTITSIHWRRELIGSDLPKGSTQLKLVGCDQPSTIQRRLKMIGLDIPKCNDAYRVSQHLQFCIFDAEICCTLLAR
jgi:hypothetical protein